MNAKNALLFVAGVVVGGTSGYFVTKKALEMKFEADMSEQIQEVKDYYKLLRKEAPFDTPEATQAVNYKELIESYQNGTIEVESEESQVSYAEVVEPEGPVRNPELPYVISVEEFMEERDEFEKNTVTYFDGDDVLCDEREAVIPDVENTVGTDSLTKFGVDSNDSKVVYVRNEKLAIDYEIILDDRSYSDVVLGFKEDKEVGRMREDD